MMTSLTPRMSVVLRVCLLAALACFPACRSDSPDAAVPNDARKPAATTAAASRTVRVVALGDSLTAGLGLDEDQAYPHLLELRLRAAGLPVEVVNAGVSGDTSAGGLRRLEWSLDGDVRVLIVALGGNDALRGLGVDQLRTNLAAIIERARSRGLTVILAGMEAPPNMGRAYASAFRKVYRDLADEYRIAFLPFLLDGVAGRPDLNQRDGIHPNAAGARVVADSLWPLVEPAVREALER